MCKDGQYYYTPKGRFFAIYKNIDGGNGVSHGTLVKDMLDREEARKQVYELNGWKYKGPVNK